MRQPRSKLARARELDARGTPVEAAAAYEEALAREEADLDAYLDLAVLYWVATDFGFAATEHLDDSFVELAGRRAFKLLDAAERRFGPQDELDFWRYYFGFITLGEPPDAERCRRLMARGSTKLPVFHLAGLGASEGFEAELAELASWAADGTTERKRYVRSVLESMGSDRR